MVSLCPVWEEIPLRLEQRQGELTFRYSKESSPREQNRLVWVDPRGVALGGGPSLAEGL